MPRNTICLVLVVYSITLISSTLMMSNLYAQNTNVTLTPEQINEVEKDPNSIIQGCSYRLGQKVDPGKLCDAFSTYLHDKCERLDYLSDYCGPIAEYFPKRIIQKQCILIPPPPDDVENIEKCINYVILNGSYANIPLRLTFKSITFDKFDDSIKTIFSVHNSNAKVLNLISISYNVTKDGNKIVSGGVGDSKITKSDCPALCFDIQPTSDREFTIPLEVASSALSSIQNTKPYIITGTFRYENASLAIISNQFNFTSF